MEIVENVGSVTVSRFLFVSYAATGHLTPTLMVARALLERGHAVAMLTDGGAQPALDAYGVQLIPARKWNATPHGIVPEKEPPPLREAMRRLRRLIRERFFGAAPDQAADLRDALSQWPADLVIASEVTPGVSLLMDSMQRPWATLAVQATCPFPSRDLFPWGFAVPPPKTWFQRAQAALARSLYRALSRPLEREWCALRQRYGLPASGNLARSFGSPHLYLIPGSVEFDAPRTDLPDYVRYIGPCLPAPASHETWTTPFRSGRPLVYATAGTTFNHREFLLKLIETARGEAFDLLVTLGKDNCPEQFDDVPDNVRLERFIPQGLILRHAAAVLCNGGSGAVMGALAHGRPLILLPLAADQPENARRVAELGVGCVVKARPLDVSTIRQAIRRVLSEPAFRERAENLGSVLSRLNGPERGAELLERLATSSHAAPPATLTSNNGKPQRHDGGGVSSPWVARFTASWKWPIRFSLPPSQSSRSGQASAEA